ncbi:MAG: hypothetical protein J6L76_06195 [Clostridia bacterium]|nr:hypothetical protein [Clostridia bacterium]
MENIPHKPTDYETLNLPENAPKEMVERKYGALLRAYKQRTDEYGVTEEDLAYYRRITEAYDRLVGTVHDYSDPNPTSVIPYKVRRVFYKFSANFEHYKFLLMALCLVAALVTIVVIQIREVEHHDLNIKFTGAYTTINQSELIAQMNEKSDTCENPDVTFFTVSEETEMDSESQGAALQFRLQFLSGAVDMVFIDRANFDVYVQDLVFLDLTEFIDSNKNNPAFQGLEYITHTNQGEDDKLPSGIYGIEFTQRGGLYFEDTQLQWINDYLEGQERSMILSICRKAQNRQEAQEYLTEIIVQTAQTTP